MNSFFALILILLPILGHADDKASSSAAQPAATTQSEKPDPILVSFERRLTQKLAESGLDRATPEYRQFAAKFRADLDAAMALVPPTSPNKGLHARILARLSGSDSRQAQGTLAAELEKNPNDHTLRLALGFVQSKQGDYSGAAASALAILDFKGEPRPSPETIAEARSLWHSNKGRSSGGAAGESRPLSGSTPRTGPVATSAQADDRPAVLAVNAGHTKPAEVPSFATQEVAPPKNDGRSPLLPLAVVVSAPLIAYGIHRGMQQTYSSEDGLNTAPDVSPEQGRRNRMNAVVIVTVPIVVAAVVFGGPRAWRAAAPTVTALWQQARGSVQRVATSEAGAVFPEEQLGAQRVSAVRIAAGTSSTPSAASRFFGLMA